MELGLNGKVAIVTGASRGIGRAIAAELAGAGGDVVLTARDAGALEGVAVDIRSGLGRKALVHAADLRQPEASSQVVAAALAAFGTIDIVVNNAGATKRGNFFELTDGDFEDGFALKFYATVRLTRAAWPHLKKSGGAILHIIGLCAPARSPQCPI